MEKIVYLMRGLPSCGKSHTAREIAAQAAENGIASVICETDQYFYTEVGSDPTQYDYRDDLLPAARQWNFERFQHALARGIPRVIVDRGNGRNSVSREYALQALSHGYQMELREPDSPWWQELRLLLRNPVPNAHLLDQWAKRLADMNRSTHRVPAATIRSWMRGWRWDLAVDDIVNAPETPHLI